MYEDIRKPKKPTILKLTLRCDGKNDALIVRAELGFMLKGMGYKAKMYEISLVDEEGKNDTRPIS